MRFAKCWYRFFADYKFKPVPAVAYIYELAATIRISNSELPDEIKYCKQDCTIHGFIQSG